jgi:flagellar hook-associated protein 1 FlgK
MSNIMGLLTIGQTALLAHQKAIDITGNNIANVNTEGYSRQRLNLVQNSPVRVTNLTMSTGVSAEQSIQRFYDEFVNSQLNSENESLGRWEAQKSALEKIEVMFDEVSGYGLSTAMSDFFNAWQDLANNPSGHVERVQLVSAAEYMTETFNQISSSIQEFQSDINTNVDNIVDEVNSITEKIAGLNQKITQVEVTGHNANDYRDERDLLVKELSKLIDIESFEDGNGNMTITVGDGKPLVENSSAWELTTTDNGGVQDVFWKSSDGSTVNITNAIDDGELKGWIETRDVLLNDYSSRMDDLAAAIVDSVNTLHSGGTTLDGTITSGVNFFDPAGNDAATISVNADILSNVQLIAAADASEDVPGGSGNAIAISELQNSSQATLGNATFDSYYNSLVGDVGQDATSANFNYEHQTSMVNRLENQRQEISGVSLDEEMVNLVKFQHAYNAAAKIITTVDEMMQTLLGMI